jgi:hypothetical protein
MSFAVLAGANRNERRNMKRALLALTARQREV